MSTSVASHPYDAAPGVADRSRRAMLAAAAGSAAAMVGLLARPPRSEAAAGSALIIGSGSNNAGTSNTILTTSSTVVAFELIQNGQGTALMGYATPTSGATRGVYGRSDSASGDGVQARNAGAVGTGAAVRAIGFNNDGVAATCDWPSRNAVNAVHSAANGTAIKGTSASGIGVYGTSTSGSGVFAQSATGWAVEVDGRMAVSSYVQMGPSSAPPNATAGTGRVFTRNNAGKIELCVIFPTGALQVIAAEA